MRLGVVVPLWLRPRLTYLTLRRIATEASLAGLSAHPTLVAVVDPSDAEAADSARSWGFEIVRAPNEPLSDKKNAGVQALRGRVDGVVFLGSDDWPAATGETSFFGVYARLLETHAAVGVLDMWYLDGVSGEGRYSAGYRPGSRRAGEPIGVGRALRADALDLVDWCPRPSGLARNHDGAMRRRLADKGVEFAAFRQEDLSIRLVDIKSSDSVTPFRLLRGLRVQPGTVLAPYPAYEVHDLLEWVGSHG